MTNSKLKELYERAGFSTEIESTWPTTLVVGTPLEKLVKIVVEECAATAIEHARSYSDGDAGSGAFGASTAIKAYGYTLFAKE